MPRAAKFAHLTKDIKSMSNKFGILAKLTFLQDIASIYIANINPSVTHNLEKYKAIKKVMYLTAIEEITGDYLEFGIFTGSSFCHAIRCYSALTYLNPSITNTNFIGFDSFEGFGTLDDRDRHPFFLKENFETSLEKVKNRIRKVAKKKFKFSIVPGFFEKTLSKAPHEYKIGKARVIFVDSDTYTSSITALNFCLSCVQEGTFFILDDFFAYHGRLDRGVAKAFNEFVSLNKIEVRKVFDYGMGGAVYIVSKLN